MIFLILILIIAVDTVVFKVLVDKMAGDLDIEKPDYLESLKHVSIANVVGTILRAWPVSECRFITHIFIMCFSISMV